MKLQFLGTGAADWPDPGERVGAGRRTASLVLDDRLMIDCGAMTEAAVREFGVDLNRLEAIIISHPHEDHFDLRTIARLAQMRDPALPPLDVRVDAVAAARAAAELTPDELVRIRLQGFTPGDAFDVAGNAVRTLPANHVLERPGELPSHFLLTTAEGRAMFSGLDGAWPLPATWRTLQHCRLDVIVWELTCGNLADWRLWGHSNLGMLRLMADAFRFDGAIHDGTVMFCSHLARTLCPPHDIYARELKTHGFILARDGLLWSDEPTP